MGLLEEANAVTSSLPVRRLFNAAVIAVAQKVEHYEIASYGCLLEWAGVLDNASVAMLLQEILEEEIASNGITTALARAESNVEARGAVGPRPDPRDCRGRGPVWSRGVSARPEFAAVGRIGWLGKRRLVSWPRYGRSGAGSGNRFGSLVRLINWCVSPRAARAESAAVCMNWAASEPAG